VLETIRGVWWRRLNDISRNITYDDTKIILEPDVRAITSCVN